MAVKIRDINKALAFFSLQAVLKESKGLFPELKPFNVLALNYLIYLYMMSLLSKPVKLNADGMLTVKLVRGVRHTKYFEFLKLHSYIQIQPFPNGSDYVWITEKSKKIVKKLLEDYEETIESLSEKFRIQEYRRVRW